MYLECEQWYSYQTVMIRRDCNGLFTGFLTKERECI